MTHPLVEDGADLPENFRLCESDPPAEGITWFIESSLGGSHGSASGSSIRSPMSMPPALLERVFESRLHRARLAGSLNL